MGLTATEGKALELLRANRRRWKVARWVCVGYGISLSALAAYIAVDAVRNIENGATSPQASLLTMLLTLAVIMFVVGGAFVVWAVVRWRGNPVHILLLKAFEGEPGV